MRRYLQEDDPCAEESPEVGAFEWIQIVVLASMSGMFSGLNLGLLGLDIGNLELLTKPNDKGTWDTLED